MQNFQLSIPKPCHQNWNEMTPTQQGRFCSSCAKEVVDFSTMTDTQVLNYFASINNEKVCGRAYPDQLNRPVTLPISPKKKLFWYWNYITMFFLFFCKTNNVKAQGGIKVNTEITKCKMLPALLMPKGQVAVNTNNNKIISGKVTDETGAPIAGAAILIKGLQQGTSTDVNGFYSLKANSQKDVIEITALGFEKQDLRLYTLNNADTVLTKLKLQTLGEVVIGGAISAEYTAPAEIKHVAVIEVIDNASLQPVKNAAVVITKQNSNHIKTAHTDKGGVYKLKNIKEDDYYIIKITADGFEAVQIKINGSEFDSGKIVKQVFLEKLPLPGDYKKMDEVIVESVTGYSKGMMVGSISTVWQTNAFTDSLKLITTAISGSLKISPNPVQKGNVFKLTIKIKHTGTYNLIIADATGRLVMQKQVIAFTNTQVENIPVPQNWSNGIYYLKVFDAKNNFVAAISFNLL